MTQAGPEDEVPASPLAMSRAEFERLGRQMLAMAADYLETRAEAPVHQDLPPDVRAELMGLPLPEQGLPGDEVLAFLRDYVLKWPMGNGSSRFFAWINPPPAPIGVLADTLSNTVNATSDGFEHTGTYLQVSTGRWMMDLCGFPSKGALALFLSGGSMANFFV